MVVMYFLYNFFAGRTFPVVEFFLEDSLDMTKQVQDTTWNSQTSVVEYTVHVHLYTWVNS